MDKGVLSEKVVLPLDWQSWEMQKSKEKMNIGWSMGDVIINELSDTKMSIF